MSQFLILKPSSLGDVLHAFPAVSALLRAYPDSVADWLIAPQFADLTAFLPGVRSNILFERKKLGRLSTFPASFRQLFKSIRTQRYDAVLDFQGLSRSAFIGRCASGLHVGPRHPREFPARLAYTKTIPLPEGVHAVERNNALVAGFTGRNDLDFSFRPPVVERFARPVRELLSATVPAGASMLVAVAPGARWETKQWPPEFFARVMRSFADAHPGVHFLLAGSSGEKPLADRILRADPGLSCSDLCGKTSVGELVELIRSVSLLFCNDSGPMHIAAMLSVPVVAFFGPTSPRLTGPYSQKSAVLQPSLPCIFCLKRYCTHCRCHAAVDADDAASRAAALLAAQKTV